MPQNTTRDWRIDFWRGLAIAMIFINHVPGNILSILTYKHWGIADAAEVFVFLSGLSIANILAVRFAGNRQGAVLFISYRCFVLYIAHLGLFLATAAISAFYMEATDSDAVIQQMALGPFFTQTELAMTRVLSLSYLPTFMDILPLYIMVLAIGGVMFVLFEKYWPGYLVAAAALWGGATYFQVNLPDVPLARTWFFNPFCWQAVFVSGFVVAWLREEAWFQRVLLARETLVISGSIVVFGVIAAAPWAFYDILSSWRPLADALATHMDKQYLAPLRYVHFLASAHVAFLALRRLPALEVAPLARVCCAVGRNALPAFGFATIITVCGFAYLEYTGYSPTHVVTISLIGLMSIAAFSTFLDRAKKTIRTHARDALLMERR